VTHKPRVQATVTVPPTVKVGEAFDVVVNTPVAGWLHNVSPCVAGWTNVAAGISTIALTATCAGTVQLNVTDTAGHVLGGPFTFTAEELVP
jgi:hypothetical protein